MAPDHRHTTDESADPHGHVHGHVHLDDAHGRAWAAHAELEGEVLLGFVTDAAAWIGDERGPQAPPVRRIIDIGSGPGVGTRELARCFPEAQLVAVDGSTAMLEQAARRAADHGLADRVSTHLAELPDGLEGLAPADVVWASMSLHHIGDEVASLRLLRELVAPCGLLVVTELGEPTRFLPEDLGVGRAGLADRIDAVLATWFAGMREDLPGAVPSDDLATMLGAAGFEVVGSRLARVDLPAPLTPDARRFAVGQLRRTREAFGERLDAADISALEVLLDADDARSVIQRPDLFVAASRQVVIARPTGGR